MRTIITVIDSERRKKQRKHTYTHTHTQNSLATITIIIIIMIIIDMINARLQNMRTQTIVKDILSDVKVNENK